MEFEIENIVLPINNAIDYSKLNDISVESNDLLYKDFFTKYMHQNIPCIIKNVTETWESHLLWVASQNKPNLSYLKNKYGDCDVTIYNCNEKYFNSQKTETCKFKTFLENDWGDKKGKLKYLKDWHLKNCFKTDNFYNVPIYFASDWLNEYLIEKSLDDYRFVYMGQEGTWTPFHADVFTSFSWSVNICGRKKWILFPPNEENLMRDSLDNLPYDITEIYEKYKHFEIIQNTGEAIFVPSGWYHQVYNLEDTISVNHNWVNGCNIHEMWNTMEANLTSVKKEIEDCRDMEGFLNQCQIMLIATFGMDLNGFYDFLEFIALHRLGLSSTKNRTLFHGHSIGTNHAIFDLRAVLLVLEKLSKHNDVSELFHSSQKCPEKLLSEISTKIKML